MTNFRISRESARAPHKPTGRHHREERWCLPVGIVSALQGVNVQSRLEGTQRGSPNPPLAKGGRDDSPTSAAAGAGGARPGAWRIAGLD
jgi:hypothetical protein